MWGKNYLLKAIGAVLAVYVLVYGLGTSLGSGISSLSNYQLNEDNNYSLVANIYNVESDAEQLRGFLKFSKDQWLEAKSLDRIDEDALEMNFDIAGIPDGFAPKADASIIISGSERGVAVLPRALNVEFAKDSSTPTILQSGPQLKAVDNMTFPYRNILKESIRNLFYHVPMWFAMIILGAIAAVYSIMYLRSNQLLTDLKVEALILVAFILGVLGLITGSIWAKNTWGTFWTNDVKLNMSAVVVMMYGTFLILRRVIPDKDRMRRISSAYNIFCFVSMIPLLFVVPRIQDSLHPGNGGNPGFGGEDLDGTMRLVFYPAVIAWTLMFLWVSNLWYRTAKINLFLNGNSNEEKKSPIRHN